ncbi:hypothetical protein JCM11491_005616 [Sporobolomyces phaffii]
MSGLRNVHALRIVSHTTARVAAPPARYAARAFSSGAAQSQAEFTTASTSTSSPPRASPSSSYRSAPTAQHLYTSSPSAQQAYLEQLLSPVSPLPNPHLIDPLLAERCLTHKSGVEKSHHYARRRTDGAVVEESASEGGRNGHNEKMSFVGRRILRLYLTLHLDSKLSTSHPSLLAHAVSPRAIDALLNTKQLGATVGSAWKLEDAMRWREVRGPTGEMTGLWKVRGMGVEAILGGIFTSQGIETASKVFHQLVLPHLALPHTLRKALDGSRETSSAVPPPSEATL